jgi:putative PIN family toxin of toxin-antitoxin system
VVLDTNVTLDWLVFCDKGTATLAHAVTTGRVTWLSCPSMRAELARTLDYPAVRRRLQLSAADILGKFDTLTHAVAEPPEGRCRGLVCRDPDDQVFVDLALVHGAKWLLSHDKLVRLLAPRASKLGIWIGPPCGFGAEASAL